jgi:DNA-binding NarL/FixJ family response regulator
MTVVGRVVVQERQRLLREGLALLLDAEPDIEMVGTAVTGPELIELCDAGRPHVAFLEVGTLPWATHQLAATLSRRHPSLRLIGRWSADEQGGPRPVRQAGVDVVLSSRMGIGALLEAVRAPERARGRLIMERSRPSRTDTLTKREIEVLALVGAGCNTHDIAGRLQISHKTVANHKQRAFRKLGVHNQAHAVSVALRSGLLSADGVIDLTADDLADA